MNPADLATAGAPPQKQKTPQGVRHAGLTVQDLRNGGRGGGRIANITQLITRHGPGWPVPQGELVSKLQALLQSGRLRIAASLPDAPALLRELQDFRVRFTASGNATFNAQEGAHDDLVLALALAAFGLSRPEATRELDVVWS